MKMSACSSIMQSRRTICTSFSLSSRTLSSLSRVLNLTMRCAARDWPGKKRPSTAVVGCLMRAAAVAAFRGYSGFQLRRLLERLREGLYGPLAVRLLTVHHEALDTRIHSDLLDSVADTGRHL